MKRGILGLGILVLIGAGVFMFLKFDIGFNQGRPKIEEVFDSSLPTGNELPFTTVHRVTTDQHNRSNDVIRSQKELERMWKRLWSKNNYSLPEVDFTAKMIISASTDENVYENQIKKIVEKDGALHVLVEELRPPKEQNCDTGSTGHAIIIDKADYEKVIFHIDIHNTTLCWF